MNSDAFGKLAARLGVDRLNAYAVEHHIAKDDPGWVGAMQMIPLLDAMQEEREKIEAAASSLPDAMRAAGEEIVRGLADDVADRSAKACAGVVFDKMAEMTDDIRAAVTTLVDDELSRHGRAIEVLTSRSGALVTKVASSSDRLESTVYNHTQDVARMRAKTESWWMAAIVILCLTFTGAFAFGEFVATSRHAAQCRAGVSAIGTSAHNVHLIEAHACRFGF